MAPIKTILCPVDFSAPSNYAFRSACLLAKSCQARLIVLHVVESLLTGAAGGMLVPLPEIDDKALVERLKKVRPKNPRIRVEHRLADGDPAAEIIRVADETDADVIVLATHGRTGLGRLLMGSVAEQVVRKATCPVVTIKGPPQKAHAAHTSPGEIAEQPVIVL